MPSGRRANRANAAFSEPSSVHAIKKRYRAVQKAPNTAPTPNLRLKNDLHDAERQHHSCVKQLHQQLAFTKRALAANRISNSTKVTHAHSELQRLRRQIDGGLRRLSSLREKLSRVQQLVKRARQRRSPECNVVERQRKWKIAENRLENGIAHSFSNISETQLRNRQLKQELDDINLENGALRESQQQIERSIAEKLELSHALLHRCRQAGACREPLRICASEADRMQADFGKELRSMQQSKTPQKVPDRRRVLDCVPLAPVAVDVRRRKEHELELLLAAAQSSNAVVELLRDADPEAVSDDAQFVGDKALKNVCEVLQTMRRKSRAMERQLAAKQKQLNELLHTTRCDSVESLLMQMEGRENSQIEQFRELENLIEQEEALQSGAERPKLPPQNTEADADADGNYWRRLRRRTERIERSTALLEAEANSKRSQLAELTIRVRTMLEAFETTAATDSAGDEVAAPGRHDDLMMMLEHVDFLVQHIVAQSSGIGRESIALDLARVGDNDCDQLDSLCSIVPPSVRSDKVSDSNSNSDGVGNALDMTLTSLVTLGASVPRRTLTDAIDVGWETALGAHGAFDERQHKLPARPTNDEQQEIRTHWAGGPLKKEQPCLQASQERAEENYNDDDGGNNEEEEDEEDVEWEDHDEVNHDDDDGVGRGGDDGDDDGFGDKEHDLMGIESPDAAFSLAQALARPKSMQILKALELHDPELQTNLESQPEVLQFSADDAADFDSEQDEDARGNPSFDDDNDDDAQAGELDDVQL